MKRNVNLSDSQIELLMQCLQIFIQIEKLFNSRNFLSENELSKLAEYTDLYEILAEQYYNDKNIFKQIS